jgi:hypothetical protein
LFPIVISIAGLDNRKLPTYRGSSGAYFPAAFRSASLIRSCQPLTVRLEIFKYVLVNPKRNQFPHAAQRRLFGRRFGYLGRGSLECRLGLGAGIIEGSGASRLVRHGFNSFKSFVQIGSSQNSRIHHRKSPSKAPEMFSGASLVWVGVHPANRGRGHLPLTS